MAAAAESTSVSRAVRPRRSSASGRKLSTVSSRSGAVVARATRRPAGAAIRDGPRPANARRRGRELDLAVAVEQHDRGFGRLPTRERAYEAFAPARRAARPRAPDERDRARRGRARRTRAQSVRDRRPLASGRGTVTAFPVRRGTLAELLAHHASRRRPLGRRA